MRGGATEGSVALRLNLLRGFDECSHECSRPAFIGGLDFGRSHSKTHTDLPYTKTRSRTVARAPQISQRGAMCQPSHTIHASSGPCGPYAILYLSAAAEFAVKFCPVPTFHRTCPEARRFHLLPIRFATQRTPVLKLDRCQFDFATLRPVAAGPFLRVEGLPVLSFSFPAGLEPVFLGA